MFQRTGGVLTSSPKCGRKGFRPQEVLESGLKKDLEELKGLEEDTDLIDKNVLQKQNDTSEDEENTKTSQAVQVFEPSVLLLSRCLTSTFIVTVFIIIVTTLILLFREVRRRETSFFLHSVKHPFSLSLPL